MFNRRSLQIMALMALLALGLGCGNVGGTETGNPGSALDQVQPQDFPPGTEAGFILDTICYKLTQCNPELTLKACGEGMLMVSTIDTELGLPAATYADYRAIMEAESQGDITPNFDKARACRAELSELSCSSQEVQGAFDPDQPSEFDLVENIFSTNTPSCESVY